MKKLILAGIVAALSALAGPALAQQLDDAATNMLARRCLAELEGANARKSIRGSKALWIQVSLQKPADTPGMDSLEADLKLTDLEGQLRSAGFKLMDPQKRSLALGLRPTLALSVSYVPKGTQGNDRDFFLVVASALQDVVPLGGSKMSMTTWLKSGAAIAATGDASKDVASIRASARACVAAFIAVAQDNEAALEGAAKP
jgi:hypothetical protein